MGCTEVEAMELAEVKDITQRLLNVVNGIDPKSDNLTSGDSDSMPHDQDGIDLEVEDALGRDDLVDSRYDDTFYYKDYELDSSSLEDGALLQIDLISNEFDAFLYIFDNSAEEHFISDDNSGTGKNARIQLKNDLSKKYRIRVTSAEPEETGKFTLVIT